MNNPTQTAHIVVRDFRGQRLYLQDFARSANSWRWTNDQRKAQRMVLPAALAAADRASREWGARCATIDAQGNLAQGSDQAAADNARALLLSCILPNGKVDSKAVLTELETRNGGSLKRSQYVLLAKIVKAFEAERKAIRGAQT